MSSGLTTGNHRRTTPRARASAQASALTAAQASVPSPAAVTGSELWRSAPATASTPVEARALTYEERRDRWRRQAGTLRWSMTDTPKADGVPSADTWRGLHP